MSARTTPFHCPYCGEQDLWPHEVAEGDSPHGAWECRGCQRAFSVRFLGLLRREPAQSSTTAPDGSARP